MFFGIRINCVHSVGIFDDNLTILNKKNTEISLGLIIAVLLRVREVPGQNIGQETG
jgi:hypothetical protein